MAAADRAKVLMKSLKIPSLIIAIEKHPVIWDTSSVPGYMKKENVEQAWFIIGDSLIPEWEFIDHETKSFCVTDMKKKWRHMKDYYRRNLLRKIKNKTLQYIYFDLLSFLRPNYSKDELECDSKPRRRLIEEDNNDGCEVFEDDLTGYDDECTRDTNSGEVSNETPAAPPSPSELPIEILVKSLNFTSFVEAMKEYPIIWNPPAGKSRASLVNKREAAWKSICEELIPKWDQMSKGTKVRYIEQIKRKWKHVRDYYRRIITKSVPEYIYEHSELLSFMKPSSADDPNKISNYEEMDEEAGFEAEYLEEIDDTVSVHSFKIEPQTPSTSDAAEPVPKKFRAEMSEKDTSARHFSSKSQTEDADLMFFRSLLPDIKMLEHDQKFEFKLGIMKLLKKIKKKRFLNDSDSE